MSSQQFLPTRVALLLATSLCLGALMPGAALAQPSAPARSLAEVRKGHKTPVSLPAARVLPLPMPPAALFSKVQYAAPGGPLAAYLTPAPADGKRHPAIVWLTGGDTNSLDDFWAEGPVGNDQSASAYRKAGIVMLFPTLRGGNGQPGTREAFFGEVDDVLAAAEYLAALPFVDPHRIYLGGHSTGGTLALLTAAASDRFRAVFSFGPVSRIERYGSNLLPVDFRTYPAVEATLRSPVFWLSGIRSRVFVIEGSQAPGHLEDLEELRRSTRNPLITFLPVQGTMHFSVLGPSNEVIARKIVTDTGTGMLAVTEAELNVHAARRLSGR